MTDCQTTCPVRTSFTLIEVVVALGLGVVLLVAIQSLIVHAYRVHATLERQRSADERDALPLALLEQDLTQRTAGGDLTLAEGNLVLDTLSALQADQLVARHAVMVRYSTQHSEHDDLRLLRQEREPGQEPAVPPVVLAAGLTAVTFELFDGQKWHRTWPPPVSRAAGAVRVVLTWRAGAPETKIFQLTPLHWRRHDE